MATLTRPSWVTGPRLLAWLAAVAALATPFILLSVAIHDGETRSLDRDVLDWVVGLDTPVLGGLVDVIVILTNSWTMTGIVIAGVVIVWLLAVSRVAFGLAVFGAVLVLAAFWGDRIAEEIVGRTGPTGDGSQSFPSGQAFGSTVFLGFWAFLAVYYGLRAKTLLSLLGLLFAVLLAVGFARIFEESEWPTDVAAAYLLGGLWLALLIPAFLVFQSVSWLSAPKQAADETMAPCETCRVERSIASRVVLDPEKGTATKVYRPPGVVRLFYWLAFQAKFPYENNRAALDTATYRRKIASALTVHRFGKDLVAGVTAVDCDLQRCSFVTKYIAGEKVENDEATKQFLAEVVETFAAAGLSVWQINPRNPHAHTNLIRTPDGDKVIIDLESAVVTPIPAPGQWRSSLRRGAIPIFDDIDFERLRAYISSNEAALAASLGADGLAAFKNDVRLGEEAIHAWQDSEPRIWGRLISGAFRLLDLPGFVKRLVHKLGGADGAAEAFLNRGVERWEREGRLPAEEAAWLRSHLASGDVQNATHHMGVHLVLSVAIAVPIPGLRSAARFLWTFTFWTKYQAGRLLRRGSKRPKGVTNVHTPLVMLIALAPAVGGVSYLASRPMRKKILIRLVLDQIAIKLPFKLYTRLRLDRRLAPARNS
ncbi:MAG: phosphatase PAP2 family protein [Chloroflexi bacterium]|nr:phosphatase PAP2 family protein [Chloroflexota bacterium]